MFGWGKIIQLFRILSVKNNMSAYAQEGPGDAAVYNHLPLYGEEGGGLNDEVF